MTRPEHISPPEIYYNSEEARKYTTNSSIIRIQQKISRRAIELLNLPKNKPVLLLDVGCGSGLSGAVLEEIPNSTWIGVDISQSMLDIAGERGTRGDLLRNDIGEALPFRPHTIDGVISISTIQWLFNADFKDAIPKKRINIFFKSLSQCLVNGGRAVLQFYPERNQYAELLNAALKAGFGGGMLCDYPNSTRQKKFYLVLYTGSATVDVSRIPVRDGVDEENDDDDDDDEDDDDDDDDDDGDDGFGRKKKRERRGEENDDKDKTVQFEWKRERTLQREKRTKTKTGKGKMKERKDRMRRKGLTTRPDSKYTGRKRSGKFW